MKKVICYGIENGKLWFGYITLGSMIASYFKNGRSLEVKPIKGFENYAYYKDRLYVDWTVRNFYHFTNWWLNDSKTPFSAIAYAENKTIEEIQKLPSIH